MATNFPAIFDAHLDFLFTYSVNKMATVSFEHVYSRKNAKESKNKPYYFKKKKKPLVLEFDEQAREYVLKNN